MTNCPRPPAASKPPIETKAPRVMSRRAQLVWMAFIVIAVSSLVSHLTVRWLGIKSTHSGYHYYGTVGSPTNTILHGSSLAYDGLNWDFIAGVLGSGVESWATPGSSPPEWEIQHPRARHVRTTCAVISPYDLNEYILCDFRADLVPFVRSVADLRKARADWAFSKRVLSQYPLSLTRKLYPTAGRSDGVMSGVRDKLTSLLRRQKEAPDGPVFASGGKSQVKEKLSDWPASRLQRRIVLTRSACDGKHSFGGPKEIALSRLLTRAATQGNVFVIVVPVSPAYEQEFLSAEVKKSFEEALVRLQQDCPAAKLVRLDTLPQLRNNDVFSDLVHLNAFGQEIATEAFSSEFRRLSRNP